MWTNVWKNLQIDTHDTHTMVWLMHSIIFGRRIKKIYEKNKSLSNPTLVKYRHIVCCFTTDIALIELQSNAKRKQKKRIFCQFFLLLLLFSLDSHVYYRIDVAAVIVCYNNLARLSSRKTITIPTHSSAKIMYLIFNLILEFIAIDETNKWIKNSKCPSKEGNQL